MTGRKLLKAAAKAAGIDGFWVDAGLNTGSSATPAIWNPLDDDGDALRLAASLEIGIDYRDDKTVNATFVLPGAGMVLEFEPCGDDAAAATRRAIVRTAAALYAHGQKQTEPA